MGFEGMCWGIFWNFVSRLVISVLLLTFSTTPVVHHKVRFISADTIRNLKPLFVICLSSCAMTVWTAWAFDILVLFSTFLNPTMAAAQTIMRTLNMISLTIPIAFQICALILTGQSVGEGNKQQAKRTYLVCLASSVIVGGISIFYLYNDQDHVFSYFTQDPLILESMKNTWPVFLTYLSITQI